MSRALVPLNISGCSPDPKLFLPTTQCPVLSEANNPYLIIRQRTYFPSPHVHSLFIADILRSVISPIQVQYDAIPFENGFQSKMTILLGNFRGASIDSIGTFRRNSNMPVRSKCVFENEKKRILHLFIQFWGCSAARTWYLVLST